MHSLRNTLTKYYLSLSILESADANFSTSPKKTQDGRTSPPRIGDDKENVV